MWFSLALEHPMVLGRDGVNKFPDKEDESTERGQKATKNAISLLTC